MNQLIGDTIVVVIQLDVVIDIDPGGFPFRKDEPIRGEGFEDGLLQGFIETLTGGLEFFKGSVIEEL
jgi:hypothetical protein